MRFDLSTNTQKAIAFVAVAAVLTAAAASLVDEDGIPEYLHVRDAQRRMEERVLDQQARNDALRVQIEKLQNDNEYIEREARDALHMVRPNEVIYYDSLAAAQGSR